MSLENALRESFSTYAGMTIMDRAIVDARDGLKPSARMAMYAQYLKKLTPDKKFQKSNISISTGMEYFYVHGDTSLYSLLARMAKPYTMRYILEDFQGNYGPIKKTGSEAAPRYTNMRLAPLAMNFFEGIDKNTIEKWYEGYTGEKYYPSVFTSLGFYNIVNGTMGIATGLSSSIPQFNLKEVNEAMIKLLYNPNIDFDEIYCIPDFATGAFLLNEPEVKESLKTGRGKSCKLRAKIDFNKEERCFTVREIPFGVYTNTISQQILDIIENDPKSGIDNLLDLSGDNPEIKIYLSKKARPEQILRRLYKETSLESHVGINMTMLDNGKVPKVFGWQEALLAHINHEKSVYRRLYEYDLKKAEERLFIVLGIIKAIENMDTVVEIIRSSFSTKEATERLVDVLLLNEKQVKAILEIKLARLVNLEVQKFIKEKESLEALIKKIILILNDENELNKIMENKFREIIKLYGDSRRTIVVEPPSLDDDGEELLERKNYILSLLSSGELYVEETSSFATQNRGGVGSKVKLKKGEQILTSLVSDNIGTLLFFTNKGTFYSYKMNNIVSGERIDLDLALGLSSNEIITAMTSLDGAGSERFILFITKKGIFKKSLLSDYNVKRKVGVKALNLDEDDEIVSVLFLNNERIGTLTKNGHFLVCETEEIRPIGRISRGVSGIKLNEGDQVAVTYKIPILTKEIVSITSDGYIKRSSINDFPTAGRNTKGGKLQKLKDKTAYMVDFTPVEGEKEVIIVSNGAKIRTKIDDIPLLGKGAQGNISIKMKPKEKIVGLEKLNS